MLNPTNQLDYNISSVVFPFCVSEWRSGPLSASSTHHGVESRQLSTLPSEGSSFPRHHGHKVTRCLRLCEPLAAFICVSECQRVPRGSCFSDLSHKSWQTCVRLSVWPAGTVDPQNVNLRGGPGQLRWSHRQPEH